MAGDGVVCDLDSVSVSAAFSNLSTKVSLCLQISNFPTETSALEVLYFSHSSTYQRLPSTLTAGDRSDLAIPKTS